MSETYLSLTGEGVAAKRGRNVEKYKEIYDQSQELYGYINSYIYQLNSQQFRNNSSSYQALREALRYLEISSLVLMAVGGRAKGGIYRFSNRIAQEAQ